MKMTIGKKLFVGFAVVILLMVVIGGMGIFELGRMNANMEEFYDVHFLGLETIKDAEMNIYAIGRTRGDLLLSTDRNEKSRLNDYMVSRFVDFEKDIEEYKRIQQGELGNELDGLLTTWASYNVNFHKKCY